jgi:hypothetical protein
MHLIRIGRELDQSLYALGSTTIDLCLSLFPLGEIPEAQSSTASKGSPWPGARPPRAEVGAGQQHRFQVHVGQQHGLHVRRVRAGQQYGLQVHAGQEHGSSSAHDGDGAIPARERHPSARRHRADCRLHRASDAVTRMTPFRLTLRGRHTHARSAGGATLSYTFYPKEEEQGVK